jgi:1,4-dihydroxy-2-naphthoyl-CoA synthase
LIPEGLIRALPPMASSIGVAFINKKISRYALTGEWMNAYQVRDIGIVDIVVPHDQLEMVTIEIVEKVKRLAPLSSFFIKQIINSVRNQFVSYLNFVSQSLVLLSTTEDFYEGMKAFIDKRKPEYKGK